MMRGAVLWPVLCKRACEKLIDETERCDVGVNVYTSTDLVLLPIF